MRLMQRSATSLRLLKFCNSLSLKPMRVCRSLHHCAFCGQDIRLGDEYRDGGLGRRAHEFCFQAVRREFK